MTRATKIVFKLFLNDVCICLAWNVVLKQVNKSNSTAIAINLRSYCHLKIQKQLLVIRIEITASGCLSQTFTLIKI